MSRSNGLDHFTRLNNSVYFYQPSAIPTSSTNGPSLILLVGWMDALPKHLSKYASGYEKLYPSAKILIITTNSIQAALHSTAANLKRITPALDVLYSLQGDSSTKILLHLFSNGGNYTSTFLARTYLQKTGHILPLAGIILDSTPGRARYSATVRAFAVGLPKNPIIRIIGVFFFRTLLAAVLLYHYVTGTPNSVEKARMYLNDTCIFDPIAPRLYIYSEADEMVDWRDVEEHIEEGRGLGFKVDKERYMHSGHAAHMIREPDRYWAAVERLWRTAA